MGYINLFMGAGLWIFHQWWQEMLDNARITEQLFITTGSVAGAWNTWMNIQLATVEQLGEPTSSGIFC